MAILSIDTNVLIALWNREASAPRITASLRKLQNTHVFVVCSIVYAELRAHPNITQSTLEATLARMQIRHDPGLPGAMFEQVAERFAQYARYRRNAAMNGASEPKRLLADFLIAGHALHVAADLMTLDVNRYRTHYPELTLID